MIKILNPTRLTRQPLFEKLINYLDQQDDVILREIKREFAGSSNLSLHGGMYQGGLHSAGE